MPPPVASPDPKQASHPARRFAVLGAVCLGIAGVAAMRLHVAAGTDGVLPAEAQNRAARLAALGPLQLERVPPALVDAAVRAISLPPPSQAALLTDLQADRVWLAWVTVYDSDAEDGDVAELRSGGFSQVVPLTRAPVRVAVPVGPDRTILLVGRTDGGGGGVTVGVVLPSGPVPLPPLSVGQTLRLPVAPA